MAHVCPIGALLGHLASRDEDAFQLVNCSSHLGETAQPQHFFLDMTIEKRRVKGLRFPFRHDGSLPQPKGALVPALTSTFWRKGQCT